MNFVDLFYKATGQEPYGYQQRLANEAWPDALNIPTGLGKTAAVTLAWIYKRRFRNAPATPRRLIWCLPMRVLVEQTQRNVEEWLRRLDLLGNVGEGRISVHLLMGGEDDLRSWAEYPEEEMILIGTQDMLLSRALMRGYGMSRYQWPVQFALLHSDSLWVFDEIQLMGSGLATSAQLEAFRRTLGTAGNCRSLWISATLNPEWLGTVDMAEHLDRLRYLLLDDGELQHPAVRERTEAIKRLHLADARPEGDNKAAIEAYLESLAAEVLKKHIPGTTTLVILNTVERAQGLMRRLKNGSHGVELLLVHARFRAKERREAETKLRESPDSVGRIVVATQAVEAGVDMTSRTLFTELAPWSSLVQRFGRCNRYGECGSHGADIYWIDLPASLASPYSETDLLPSRERLPTLTTVSPAALPPTDQPAPETMVLRRKDFLELFNTDPDLSGFDIDISPYVRDAEDTDVQVFWREIPRDRRGAALLEDVGRPRSEEICRASLSQLDAYLKRIRRKQGECWYWDALDGKWTALRDRIRPGLTLLLDAALGGYPTDLGFLPADENEVQSVPLPESPAAQESYSDDPYSRLGRAVPLDRHLCHVEQTARALCNALGMEGGLADAVIRAARWHDVGKAHAAFQNMLCTAMRDPQRAQGMLWAKSDGPIQGKPDYYIDRDGQKQPRPCFRHELASALAWLAHNGHSPQADLVAYLIAAHHGKVRMGLRAQPGEAQPDDAETLFARGIWAGDRLPAVRIDDTETVPPTELRLDIMQLGEGPQGSSWTARTQSLLTEHGPFRLAWLETLVRLADWRATRQEHMEPMSAENMA